MCVMQEEKEKEEEEEDGEEDSVFVKQRKRVCLAYTRRLFSRQVGSV